MIIGYDNQVMTANLSMTNESPLFPVANLKDTRLSRFTRVLGTDTRIVISKEGLTATSLFMMSNLTATASVKIEANTSNAWTTPAFSETVTWKDEILTHFFDEETYDYWSILISDSANTEDVKIGGVFLGDYFDYDDVSHNMTIDDVDTTIQTWSKSGQSYTDDNYVYERYTFALDVLTLVEVEVMRAIVRAIKRKPVWIYLSTEFKNIYAVYEGNMTRTRKFNNIYSLGLTFREAK